MIRLKRLLAIAIACCLYTPMQGKPDSAPIAVNAPANSTSRMVIIAMPRFPGGDVSFFTDFLKEHLHYPKAAVKKKIGGDVSMSGLSWTRQDMPQNRKSCKARTRC